MAEFPHKMSSDLFLADTTVVERALTQFSDTADGDIARDWTLGLTCDLGDGYLGARLQPHLPEGALRLLLGAFYAVQGLC
ncbi:hypothetical protein [Kitasatospora sp. NPDC057223]|uniref:hypothetical protein n=1 Tax=Kitasatospora sp. NPDC057223 TaxID=3346055 RepID=UPI00363D1DE4